MIQCACVCIGAISRILLVEHLSVWCLVQMHVIISHCRACQSIIAEEVASGLRKCVSHHISSSPNHRVMFNYGTVHWGQCLSVVVGENLDILLSCCKKEGWNHTEIPEIDTFHPNYCLACMCLEQDRFCLKYYMMLRRLQCICNRQNSPVTGWQVIFASPTGWWVKTPC